VNVTVRCFAAVRELLGASSLEVELPDGGTVGDLKALLAQRAPDLQRLRVASAVNQEYASDATRLRSGDEVALIPPISGGSGAEGGGGSSRGGGSSNGGGSISGGGRELFRFDLVAGPLDPRALEAEARSDQDGAIVTFAGVTRDHNEGRAVRGLRYEAYDEMARKVMIRLFEEAVKRFPIGRARVVHRLGAVPIGEASVVVVVAAPHRGAAFDACRFLMDRLKAEVPIFKQEFLAGDGGGGDDVGSRWVGELPAT
jgi:molybdopterin synthase catalytic subunit